MPHRNMLTDIIMNTNDFFCSRKTPQVCLLWEELQAAQLSGGAQGAMSQLPPVHGAAEQHLHRLVPCETHTYCSSHPNLMTRFTGRAGLAMHVYHPVNVAVTKCSNGSG